MPPRSGGKSSGYPPADHIDALATLSILTAVCGLLGGVAPVWTLGVLAATVSAYVWYAYRRALATV